MSLFGAYDDDNVFAKILRGELPCVRVFEDEVALAIMDLFPQAPGHLLVGHHHPVGRPVGLPLEGHRHAGHPAGRLPAGHRPERHLAGHHPRVPRGHRPLACPERPSPAPCPCALIRWNRFLQPGCRRPLASRRAITAAGYPAR